MSGLGHGHANTTYAIPLWVTARLWGLGQPVLRLGGVRACDRASAGPWLELWCGVPHGYTVLHRPWQWGQATTLPAPTHHSFHVSSNKNNAVFGIRLLASALQHSQITTGKAVPVLAQPHNQLTTTTTT